MSKEKIAIGFDLGTTSVGWAIIKYNDEEERNCTLIDRGVRVFESLQKQNQERREARSSRRRIARKNYKQYKLFTILKKNNFVKNFDEYAEFICNQPENKMPFEIKCDVIENKKKLTNHELVYILNSYIKKRGYFYELEIDDKYSKLSEQINELEIELENSKNDNESEKELKKIEKKLINKQKERDKFFEKYKENYNEHLFPCQYQRNLWELYGKVNLKLNNLISNKNQVNEIETIFQIQFENDYLEFRNNVINLIKMKREYWEGPGSENQYSKWGRYDENGNIKWDKLYEKQKGKCSWFLSEDRTLKNSPKYIIFNIVNKLSSIRFEYNQEKFGLSKQIIFSFLNIFFSKTQIKTKISVVDLNKYLIENKLLDKVFHKYYDDDFETNFNKNLKDEKITICGIKLDKNNNTIENIQFLAKFLNTWKINNEFKFDLNNLNKINQTYKEINSFIDKEKKEFNENIKKIFKLSNNQFNENLKVNKKIWEDNNLWINYGSLSEKALDKYLEYFFNNFENKNQMLDQMSFRTIHIIPNADQDVFSVFKNKKYFPKNFFKDEILPPGVKRIFEQAINVFNAILKNYVYNNKYDIDFITIELARELNNSESKEKIKEIQTQNENFLKNFEEIFPKEFNTIKNKIDNNNLNSKRLKMMKLWCEQNGKDVYKINNGEFENIKIEDIFKDKVLEIDHIFSYKWTKDNSFSNIVLTKSENNQEKQDKTPYEYLKNDFNMFIEKWKDIYFDKNKRGANLNNSPKISKSKFEKLSFKGTKNDIPTHFLTNALNDTRYATTLFINYLKKFTNVSNEKLTKTKLNSINGMITNQFRFLAFSKELEENNLLIKDRHKNDHHSIDALICCVLGKEKWAVDKENYDIIHSTEEINDYGEKISKIHHNSIREWYKNLFEKESLTRAICKFSTKSFKEKNNFKFFDQKPLSAIIKDGIVYKISKQNLLDLTKKELDKWFNDENKPNNLLMDDFIYNYIHNLYKENKHSIYKSENDKNKKFFYEYFISNEEITYFFATMLSKKTIDKKSYILKILQYKGIPIIKVKKNNDIQIVNYIKNFKYLKDKKLDENKLEKLNKSNPDSIYFKFNKQKKLSNKSSLKSKNTNKFSCYNGLKSNKILIFKINNDKYEYIYLTFKWLKWNSKNEKLVLNIKSIIEESKLKNVNWSKILCSMHKNNLNFDQDVCEECEKKLLFKDSKYHISIYDGKCFYKVEKNHEISINTIYKNPDYSKIYYRIGGSQANENIRLKNIYITEPTTEYINKINDINKNIQNSFFNEKYKYENMKKQIKFDPKNHCYSINSFIEKFQYILDIDRLGNIRKIKKIFE